MYHNNKHKFFKQQKRAIMPENETTNATAKAEQKAPVQVTIPQLLQFLKEGKTRKEQAKLLGVPFAQLNKLYASNEQLKGKKVFKERGARTNSPKIVLVDAASTETAPAPSTETAPASQPETTTNVTETPVTDSTNKGW